MKKVIAVAAAVVMSISMYAGTSLKYDIDGSERIFLAQNNNLKVITGKTTPWMLFDLKNSKIFIIEDEEKKYVEMTKAELDNMVNAADNLQNAFGKGKLDLKALTTKKQANPYNNPYTLSKGTGTKASGAIKASNFAVKDAKGKAGSAYYSPELEKMISKDVDYNKVIRQILDMTTTKVILDKLTPVDKFLVDMLDSGLKTGKAGAIFEAGNKDKTLIKFVSMENKEIQQSEFKVPEGYAKKSLKDFLGK